MMQLVETKFKTCLSNNVIGHLKTLFYFLKIEFMIIKPILKEVLIFYFFIIFNYQNRVWVIIN